MSGFYAVNSFSCLMIFAFLMTGLGVILSPNPVHSVFFLILVFLLSAALMILLGAEFLAILLIIIYVGALSILFLFVVMMLNLRILEHHSTFYNYLPLAMVLCLMTVLIAYFSYGYDIPSHFFKSPSFSPSAGPWVNKVYFQNNLHVMAFLLYNYYSVGLVLVSMILLVSMIGTIILTVDFHYRSPQIFSLADSFFFNVDLLGPNR